ncbi:MAG: hypothetical protein V4727_03355 [Verrucomicrobiota bacterium]
MKRLISLLLTVIIAMPNLFAEEAWRKATIIYSDGSTVKGSLLIQPGTQFKLVTAKGAYTENLGRTEMTQDNRGKVFELDYMKVREISFMPRPDGYDGFTKAGERYEGSFTYERVADDSRTVRKVFNGDRFPVRDIVANFRMMGDEQILGTLHAIPIYLKEEGQRTAKKIVLQSKQRGTKEQSMDDLVYIQNIRLEGGGIEYDSFHDFALKGEGIKELRAVTRKSLAPCQVIPKEELPGTFRIQGHFGEPVYLCVKKGENYRVGWPQKSDPDLLAKVQSFSDAKSDFFTDKKVLGVIQTAPNRVHALTVLRRLEDRVNNSVYKPVPGDVWRISVWEWGIADGGKELVLLSRGTLQRGRVKEDAPIPDVVLDPQLWVEQFSGSQTNLSITE